MDQNEHPAASRRGFLRSGGMAALFGATAAATVASAAAQTEMVSPELRDLIEKHRAAAEILRKAEARYVEAEAKCEEGTPKHVPFSSWCRDAARYNEPAPLLHPYGLKNCLARAEWEIRVRAPVDDALKALPIARQKQITAALKVLRSPTLDRRRLEFSGSDHDDGLGAPPGLCRSIGTLYPIALWGLTSL